MNKDQLLNYCIGQGQVFNAIVPSLEPIISVVYDMPKDGGYEMLRATCILYGDDLTDQLTQADIEVLQVDAEKYHVKTFID